MLEDPNNSLGFSVASLWELVIKQALAVRQLPPLHRDPFDRLLLAQAQVEGMLRPSVQLTSSNSSSNRRWAAAGTKRWAAMAPLTATGGTPIPGNTPAPQSAKPLIGVPPPGKAPRLAGQAGP